MTADAPGGRGRAALDAFDRFHDHPDVDGEGIQLAVDLDVALSDAGLNPLLSDGLTRDKLAARLQTEHPEAEPAA